MLWLTAVGALTPHFVPETSAIDNAKTPNTTNLYSLDANHNHNKIVKSDWLSTALISALIGQFNRTVHVMPK